MGKSFYRSELHRKKLKKNLAVLAMIAGFCAIIWIVTMLKIAGN